MQIILRLYATLVTILLLLTLTNCKHTEDAFYDRIIYDKDSTSPLVTFLYNPKDSINVAYNMHIKKTINYTKIPYKTLHYKILNKTLIIPKTTKVLVITNTKAINEAAFKRIVAFVAHGGTVFMPAISTDYKYRFLAGLKPNIDTHILTYAKGLKFLNYYLPDFKNCNYSGNDLHYGFKASDYNDQSTVWATASNNPKFPTIIKHTIGEGHVISLNTKLHVSKHVRGLYFSALLSGLEGIPYPVLNTGVLFLDDFPAPTYHIKKEPIKTEYNITHSDFYNKIWWPDMVKLAQQEDLKYTAIICFDYGNKNKPPFLFNEWSNSKTTINNKNVISGDYLISDIIKHNHELAFHGYNHTSLLQKDWPNFEFMSLSLKAVTKKWKVSNYGALPLTYVPPSNRIDEMGFHALKEGITSIKYNCSLYLGTFKEGGEREYDYESYNTSIFNFPRITSGYTLGEPYRFNQQSLFLYTGIWSHFIHPDDVYQIKDASNTTSKGDFEYRNKNNLGWITSKDGRPGMLPLFKSYIKHIKRLFPLLRFVTTKAAAQDAILWRYSTYEHSDKPDSYQVSSYNKSLKSLKQHFWFVYIKNNHSKNFEKYLTEHELKFSKIPYLEGFLFNIETRIPSLKLKKINREDFSKTIIPSTIIQRISTYRNTCQLNDIVLKIKNAIALGDTDKAITLLKAKINSETINNIEDWRDLYKYLGWQHRTHEIWTLLDKKYTHTPSLALIDLSLEFIKNSDYPNLDTRKLWLERQIISYPENTDLKTQYAYYFKNQTIHLQEKWQHNYTKNTTNFDITNAYIYANKGHLKHAWILTANLPESSVKQHLKKHLNKTILTLPYKDKAFLYNNYKSLFYNVNAKKIDYEMVRNNYKYIRINSGGIADNNYTIALNNTISFGFYTTKKQQHYFSFKQSERYGKQQCISSNTHGDLNLLGISYGFKTKKSRYKSQWALTTTLEKATNDNMFVRINAHLILPQQSTINSIVLNHQPALTSAAYRLNIYNTQLDIISHYTLLNYVKCSLKLFSNYFSDNSFNVGVTQKIKHTYYFNKQHGITPNFKVYGLLGNKNNAFGFPYWNLKKRLYYGGGFSYNYKNALKNISFHIAPSFYYDTYYTKFVILKSGINYELLKHLDINAVVTLSTIENVFTNPFNLGITYYLK